MADARFMDEVIRVGELVREGNLTEIEGESKHIIVQLTSLRAFMSSLKHRVNALSGGGTGVEVEPAGRGGGEDDDMPSM